MSFETNLNTIATSLSSIAKSLETLVAKQAEATDLIVRTVQDKPVAAPVQVAPVAAPVAAPAAPVVAAPVIPPVLLNMSAGSPPSTPVPVQPTPTAGIPAPVTPNSPATTAGSCPFSDAKGLMTYTMGKYKELGPIKGASIQNVLTELGCKNINEVPAEKYADYWIKVEAL